MVSSESLPSNDTDLRGIPRRTFLGVAGSLFALGMPPRAAESTLSANCADSTSRFRSSVRDLIVDGRLIGEDWVGSIEVLVEASSGNEQLLLSERCFERVIVESMGGQANYISAHARCGIRAALELDYSLVRYGEVQRSSIVEASVWERTDVCWNFWHDKLWTPFNTTPESGIVPLEGLGEAAMRAARTSWSIGGKTWFLRGNVILSVLSWNGYDERLLAELFDRRIQEFSAPVPAE